MPIMKRLLIERLGHRGEGVARDGDARVFVPYALAGETVLADVEGEQARLAEIVDASPDRIAPICPHYAHCGGCAVQALRAPAYADWKRGLVETALRNAGLSLPVGPLVDAHGAGRRRVTFHARMEEGRARVGFMAARSHELVEIDACPLLAPELAGALPAARAIARILAGRGKPLDLAMTATLDGLDVELRGAGPLEEHETGALIAAADAHDLARLTNHGRLVALRSQPYVMVGAGARSSAVGRLSAGDAGGRGRPRRAGSRGDAGRETCRRSLLRRRRLCAAACRARAGQRLRQCRRGGRGHARRRPRHARASSRSTAPPAICSNARSRAPELAPFDAVVFDPPRAGAMAQATEIAKSKVRGVVAVSCSAQSFARDAAILIKGGFETKKITPVDQFRFSPHVEIVATFSRGDGQKRAKRSLLG